MEHSSVDAMVMSGCPGPSLGASLCNPQARLWVFEVLCARVQATESDALSSYNCQDVSFLLGLDYAKHPVLLNSSRLSFSNGVPVISGCDTIPKFLRVQGEDRESTATWQGLKTGLMGKA